MKEAVPTKGNLLKLKDMLKLSKSGHALLEKKRNVLLREITSLIEKAQKLQDEILEVFERAYKALQFANLDLGMEYMDEISRAIPEYKDLEVRMKSVMGVEVPEVKMKFDRKDIPYGIYRSNTALDKAYLAFVEVLKLVAEAAWIENTIYRLAFETKKTRKRVNALENIVIPQLTQQIKYIQDVLEEAEREEFIRTKKVKDRKAS
ncbi:MAG: V-type ATP synthase subunit D [Thermotogaceae bacterium]|nr:V-type ATP synthase subunit D [Thermotogaceae bacterium]